MAIPSRVLAAGNAPLSTETICGAVASGLTATGTNLATALQLSADISVVATTAASGASSLTVYARTGQTVDGAASVAIAAGKERIFFGISPTIWLSHLGA